MEHKADLAAHESARLKAAADKEARQVALQKKADQQKAAQLAFDRQLQARISARVKKREKVENVSSKTVAATHVVTLNRDDITFWSRIKSFVSVFSLVFAFGLGLRFALSKHVPMSMLKPVEGDSPMKVMTGWDP